MNNEDKIIGKELKKDIDDTLNSISYLISKLVLQDQDQMLEFLEKIEGYLQAKSLGFTIHKI